MTKTRKLTPEHIAAIRAANVGKVVSPETRAKISKAHMGHPVTPATRAKIAAAHLGYKFDRDVVERRAAKMRGQKRTAAQIARISAGRRRGLKQKAA